MNLIILLTFLVFLFYYLSSFNNLKLDHKWIFILCFIISAFALRLLINPNINKDYYAYFHLFKYDNPKNAVSFLLSEPYLYLINKFFAFFTSDKVTIFKGMYWFNFLITNVFFIWLATRKDILIWKKIVLFVFYYFLFGYVLLRNGPVYILYAYFFYYSYRNIKYNKVILTPFMHLSGLALLVILFQRKKYYLKMFFFAIVLLAPLFFIYLMPLLSNVVSAQDTLSKVDTYSKGIKTVSIFHKIHVVFITIMVLISIWFYKKKVINPIFITTVFFYYIAFTINPVLGFRFSPYVFFAIFLFNFNGMYNTQLERNLSIGSFLLFPYFLSTLFNTNTF